MGRIDNTYKNMYTGLINQIIVLIFRFVTRTVFIQALGSQYLGINGLFSNILTFLSLADLGIGASLVFSLYKPIADKDYEKQNIINNYLKKVYFYIGLAIIAFGICLMPFLKFIITEDVPFVNIYIVFFIYVFQMASTYLFFASKSEFLMANQKRYIYNNISSIMTIISNLAQIVVLLVFKNFYLYLITIIVFNVLQAYFIARKTDKMYPFLKVKYDYSLSKEERKKAFDDCRALMLYRVNYIVLVATDNIIISRYLGLTLVGIYSNYVLITNSIVNVLSTFFNSINASLGNLFVSEGKDKNYYIFKINNFITVVCFGIFGVGVYLLANDFIYLWLGKDYVLSSSFALILAVNLYVEGLRKLLSTYRTNYGLFVQAKYLPLVGMILNIVISVILVQYIGIFGVLLGTLLSNLLTFIWFDPYVLYKKIFKEKVWKFYLTNILYVGVFAIIALICKLIFNFINLSGILGFVVKGVILVVISLIVVFIIFSRSEYLKYVKEIIKSKLKRGKK